MRKRRQTKGETLVETIVSFAVVLLTLITITAVVQLCIRLNNRAMERAEALEEACASIERGEDGGIAPRSGALTLTVTEGDGTDVIVLPIEIFEGGPIGWFRPSEAGGG